MIKFLNKLGIEGSYLNVIRTIYCRPIATYTEWAKTESIYSKRRKETRLSTITTLIQ
jgi:hypothetical protein